MAHEGFWGVLAGLDGLDRLIEFGCAGTRFSGREVSEMVDSLMELEW